MRLLIKKSLALGVELNRRVLAKLGPHQMSPLVRTTRVTCGATSQQQTPCDLKSYQVFLLNGSVTSQCRHYGDQGSNPSGPSGTLTTYSHHSVWPLPFSTYTRFTEACYPRLRTVVRTVSFTVGLCLKELAQTERKEMASFPLVRV